MLLRKALKLLVIMLLPVFAMAQVTTSSIIGTVSNESGAPLEGATIKAIHTPSGTVYSTLSRSGGNFTIPNMRVGGPYTITISYVGFQDLKYDNINLDLGDPTKLTPVLIDSSTNLADVSVLAQRNSLISKNLTGTSVSVGRQEMSMLPTISRNINDFARLSPIAQVRTSSSDGSPMGISFGGQSTRYNQFTIDGANATDVFGLSSNGTNGGQAGINPIPFDAIDQLQVILAPYDVTQGGFTGGGMNAVTRSGTNELHGSAYGFFQNQGLVGKSIDTRDKYGKFSNWQYGARLGGAIIKDKLFYFINYEGLSRSQPVANQPGSGSSNLGSDEIAAAQDLSDYLKSEYNYDAGAITGLNQTRKSNSVFARIDWNINDKNKLMIRHNYVNGNNYSISDASNSMSFGNNGYTFRSKTNSTVLELNSSFNSGLSNMLRLTYTSVNDKRDVGSPFPSVSITDNGATYKFGNDYSSQANSLDQHIATLTDNLNIYKGNHTITLGTDNEFYTTKNIFLQGLFGDYTYKSLDDFYNNTNLNQYQTTYSTNSNDPYAPASVKMGQFGLYAQDAWSIKNNFKLTYGLRADLPVFFNDPVANDDFNSSDIAKEFNVQNNQPPKSKILLSPRLGFNWDVFNDAKTQIRGGVGLFTGRVPMVWVSNQYSNTGKATIKYKATASDVAANGITFDPSNPYRGTPAATATEIDLTDRNFVAPRTLRANLALDQKLGWGLVLTVEGVYTKIIKDIMYQDLNLKAADTTLDLGNGVTRPFYGYSLRDSRFTNVLYLTNTNQGHAYNVYVRLKKEYSRGWMGSISYSLGHSYGLSDGTSSTALSNYRFAYNINGLNNLDVARNNTDQGSRVSLMIGKQFNYGKFSTNLGLFYNGQSGQTLSYVVYGDLNGDDGSKSTSISTSGGADLMYIPTSADDFAAFTKNGATVTPEQQLEDWNKYLASNDYLSANKGKNLKRNGTRLPWENHVDFKFAEDFQIAATHKITLSVDIFNIGNLISKNWGKAYYSGNQELTPLTLKGFQTTSDPKVIKPVYTFNSAYGLNQYTNKPWAYSDYLSRWSMQIGLRYTF
ncbi:TonB-dependent Receptor Plug Domain [Arachidicoccus rhizosphaerae]|uniref:TonB-dependent Receptor Plug Domain n=1 Tax=Arachidicoccus rhizosphaerae TaxID=551991 RepID=A0A1H4B864_9BACT|nr:carboxypeptidase regulatory-like domain-containing protein [Arachidicoccus rhizosphaerae]SEA44329.1 TonB-dependent Receptor Plug Domain [Arachidicoccus rhizosphaerae]